jgi:TolA-binding protein
MTLQALGSQSMTLFRKPAWLAVVLVAVFCLGAILAPPAWAQDEDKADDGAATADAAAVAAAPIPDTLAEVQAQITEVQQQIEKLNGEAEQLITMAEQEKRQQVRTRIKSLRLRLRILQRRENQLTGDIAQADVQAIREKYRARLLEIENRKATARRMAIARFEKILSESPNTGLAADILFRLANLYFEEAHAQYLDSWDRYEYEAEQLMNQGATDVVPEEPMHNYTRTVELLSEILRNYPQYEKRDEVLYLMAYCLQEQNDDDRALLVYARLVKEMPESDKVPETHVRMGEIFFNRDQYDRAIEQYKQLLKFTTSKFYDKALYKLGWSYYKLSDYENAVKYFSDVLTHYKNRPVTRRHGRSDDLLQESVDYIAISFTEAEGLDGGKAAVGFMNQLGDEEIGRQVLLKVGEVYDERTDYEPARGAYNAYLKTFPLAPDVPEVMSKLAQTYEKEARFEDAMEVYDLIAKTLGPGSEWTQVNGRRKVISENAAKLVQRSIMARATFHHEKAQNTTGAESQAHYVKAIESYELYLANYPDAKGAYETAFNLAESYMEVQRYPEAARQYQIVIDRKQDKELWTSALFNNTKAFELQVDKDGGLPNKEALAEPGAVDTGTESPKGVEIKPTRMGESTASWIAALETHVTGLPESDKSPAMLYKIGEIYYLHGDFANSDKYFEQVFAKYPQNEVVALASYYYTTSSKQTGNYAQLKEKLAVIPEASGITSEQKQMMSAGAQFKIAESKMKQATATTPPNQEAVRDAIAEYENGITADPGGENTGVALYNVAVAHENYLKDLISANEAYTRLASSYPKHKQSKPGLLRAAYNYQILAEFDQAIQAYELYVRNWSDDRKGAGDALFNQAALLEESGRYSQAISAYQQYLTSYASETDAGEVAFNIARLYEKMGDDASAARAYEDYASRGADDALRMSESYYRWGRILGKQGDLTGAENRYLQSVAVYMKARDIDPTVEARFAAEAQFRIANQSYKEYNAIVFTGDIRRDANLLKEKAEAFKKLKVYYEQIVTFGSYEWATASLHMIGVINQNFSDALLTAPVPDDLPLEQQDEYIFKLEEIAFPIKNRALEAFKQNVNKGVNERLINEWIVKSYQELVKLEPQTQEPKFEMPTSVDVPAFALAPLDSNMPAAVAPPAAAPTTGGAK